MPSVSKAAAAASASPPQTEKPTHYRYLKEFRTEQCALFLQRRCARHRPFTCFHWHFRSQQRRRPLRRRDGTFNYSADVYCAQYDAASGLCPDGDGCPYLHRPTGDTERKYHLRYYKTGTCIHETDARGRCVKNGPHCAFAHGPLDLRPPVCDIRELQAQEALHSGQPGGGGAGPDLQPGVLASQAMIERILGEDPRWQDASFVLGSYKTEQCPKPPRLCRQGYACPHFHSSRDRRRDPRRFQYRSTPCPSVKLGDEWGEASRCDGGDACQYCHSRTEQQFHPEIYKSTKCYDMRQTGSCPRGPFCAFAHAQTESLGTASDWGCPDPDPTHSTSASGVQLVQNHLAVFALASPLASVSSSVASSLAGSGSSSPTAPPALPSHVLPWDPAPGPAALGSVAPGTALGHLPRSPSLHSSSSLSTSPRSSLTSAMTPPQQPPPPGPEPGSRGLGLNGVPGSVWDYVSSSFSPSPSPGLSAGPTSSNATPNGTELARVRRQLDEARRKIRQWEESWQQVKQACDAWQREAREAQERARAADSDRQAALRRKEAAEAQVQQLREELEGLGVASLPDVGAIPLPQLHSLQTRLRLDLEAVDGVIGQLRAKQSVAGGEPARGGPCEPRAASTPECPPPQW
ncbi:LOW QUALITY PROTEIN: putative E3 ubiquitin-protein ligase UNKL [Lepus europaeus]|uniref:LOW QUALITY PROTEIN: putative E3 ubiquitin-protein ligase UNKL n=1 Tax=Lepus europaeus TaxID=9983 RepID=UPI002B48F5E7|nr:LOW QUALITY PROTEIN: putative E3 ubiquitin-protein ligase UNKL [Lepus europaeus]